mmetsp:Transcript_33870/g.79193  ORF Transcript_33870/g.79193 Transcript_33870/m.79193 type:complete len:256 (+) Transcript_33870:330-1097(+)
MRRFPYSNGLVRRAREQEVHVQCKGRHGVLVSLVLCLQMAHAVKRPTANDTTIATTEESIGDWRIGQCKDLIVWVIMSNVAPIELRHRDAIPCQGNLPEGQAAVVRACHQHLRADLLCIVIDAARHSCLRARHCNEGAYGIGVHRCSSDLPQLCFLLSFKRPYLESRILVPGDDHICAWQVYHGSDLVLLFVESLDSLQRISIPHSQRVVHRSSVEEPSVWRGARCHSNDWASVLSNLREADTANDVKDAQRMWR